MVTPWKTISSKIVYSDPYTKLVVEKAQNKKSPKINTFAISEKKSAAYCLAIDSKLRGYITHEYTYGTKEWHWLVPGGGIEKGEEPKQTAIRELLEEAGIETNTVTYLGKSQYSPTFIKSNAHSFVATNIHLKKRKSSSEEIITKLKAVPLKKLVQMVMSGKITEAGSSITILKAEQHLRNKGLIK